MESNYCIYLLEAAVLTVICGWVGIPLLKKLKARQSIRTEGPKSHRAKSGTPTMGGLFMLTAMVLVVLFNRLLDPSVLWLLFLTLGHGLLGFLDDFIKAEKKRNLGLTAKQKMLGQLILAVNAKSLDMIIAGMSPTAERKEAIDFSDAYYTSQLVIVVRKAEYEGKYANATKLADFKGAKIAAQIGTFHNDALQAQAIGRLFSKRAFVCTSFRFR